jgi:hypothetical protein
MFPCSVVEGVEVATNPRACWQRDEIFLAV